MEREPIKGFYTVDAHEIREGDDIEVSATIWTKVLAVAKVEKGYLVWGRGLRHPLAVEGFARVGRPLSQAPSTARKEER